MSTQNTAALLRLLREAGIEHLVVGRVAAVAWGSSEYTRDLDISIPFDVAHIERLLQILAPYHPKHASRPDLGIIQDPPERLASFRILLISTDLGRLDVLPGCEGAGTFEELRSRATSIAIADGEHWIIGIDDLIAVKEHVARPKDLIVAAQLRAIRTKLSLQ